MTTMQKIQAATDAGLTNAEHCWAHAFTSSHALAIASACKHVREVHA